MLSGGAGDANTFPKKKPSTTKTTKKLTRPYRKKGSSDFLPNLIKENIMNIMPKLSINLHLGLSPWYRGSATLFWPFYNLQPQFAGSTFHQIVNEPDAGDILHQTIPVLKKGDTLHEVAAKVVIQSTVDAVKLLKIIEKDKK